MAQNPTINSRIIEYPLPSKGVNLADTPTLLNPQEAVQTKNLHLRSGLEKREGLVKFSSTALAGGSTVLGLHRFSTDVNEVILAASGVKVEYGTGGTWTTLHSAFSNASTVHFTTWYDSCYYANGVDTPRKITAALADSAMSYTFTGGQPKQFLSYQDRLLAIVGGALVWSGSYNDTIFGTAAEIGVKPDTTLHGMCIHSEFLTASGNTSKVLLAGENGMYLFSGTNLIWPSAIGNYELIKISSIGCKSPKSMVWTPKGTFWLGMDAQVYMLPFYGNSGAIPVGDHIRSSRGDYHGIEGIPTSKIAEACATYNDGFYKLSYAPYGGSTNLHQYWLDVLRMGADEHGHAYPWYGPMVYTYPISCFADGLKNSAHSHLGGATVGGSAYIYNVDDDSSYADDALPFTCTWTTSLNPLSDTIGFNKNVNKAEFDLIKHAETVALEFLDFTGLIRTAVELDLPNELNYWGESYWGETYWTGVLVGRKMFPITPTLQVRMLGLQVSNNSASKLAFYGARVEAEEQSLSLPG